MPSSKKRFLFWNHFFRKGFYFLGSILSQPVPVPGRDKIIPKKPKAHNNKKGKQRNQKKKKPNQQKEKKEDRNRKARERKTLETEERTRTEKKRNPQISNLSKIESNFGNSGYVESVIVKTGILEINNRETKTMDPLNLSLIHI